LRPDKRIRIRREPHRGHYDRETIDAILDEALICHLGFDVDGQPYVIPTLHARVGDNVYVHGSAASRMLRHLASDVRVCLTVNGGPREAEAWEGESLLYFLRERLGHAEALPVQVDRAVEILDGDADVMGDENDRQPEFALQFAEQQQHLDLDRGIERRGRLVGEQQARSTR